MAATGNEVVLLRQLKDLYDSLVAKINGVLAPGSVTTDKIAADAITADKIATGAVTSDAIADGTVTAADIAAGVIPDVSGFITGATADGKYAAKNHTHTAATTGAAGFMSAADKTKLNGLSNYTLPKASASALGGIQIGYTESGKNYPVELDSSGKAFVNVPWTDTNTTYGVATTSSNGLMSSADKTKLDGLKNYTLPAATSTTLGGVKVATYEDAKGFLGY